MVLLYKTLGTTPQAEEQLCLMHEVRQEVFLGTDPAPCPQLKAGSQSPPAQSSLKRVASCGQEVLLSVSIKYRKFKSVEGAQPTDRAAGKHISTLGQPGSSKATCRWYRQQTLAKLGT